MKYDSHEGCTVKRFGIFEQVKTYWHGMTDRRFLQMIYPKAPHQFRLRSEQGVIDHTRRMKEENRTYLCLQSLNRTWC